VITRCETVPEIIDKPIKRRTLEKAYLDWNSIKTQMTAAAILIIASALLSFLPTLRLGFMGDDFGLIAACRGLNFTTLNEPPLGQLSLLLNFIISHTHSGAYHGINIGLYCACALLTGLITLELSGSLGNRHGAMAALWSGLLFTVYPLAVTPVASIALRDHLLGLFFYLTAIYAYQRFSLLRESLYTILSLTAALLAALTSPLTISLPLAISAMASAGIGSLRKSWPYFAIAAVSLAFASGRQFLEHCITLDFDSNVLKLLLANNEAVLATKTIMMPALILPVVLSIIALLRFIFREGNKSRAADPTLALVVWLLASVLLAGGQPIAPDLAGCHNYIFIAAPLSILLSFMAFGRSDYSAAREKVSVTFALAALGALYLLWSYTLAANLKPWIEAGRTMNILRRQIEEASFAGPTVLLDLPLKINGVPCISDASQISTMLQPPFTGVNLSKMAAIGTAKIDLDLVGSQSRSGPVLAFLGNELVPVRVKEQGGPDSFSLNFRSPSDLDHIAADNDLVIEDATKWHETSSKNKIQFSEQFARLTNAGNKPLTIWLPWKIGSAQAMLGKNLRTLKIDDGGSSNPQFEIVLRHLNDDDDAPSEPVSPKTESKVVAPGDRDADLTALPGYLLSLQPRQLGLRIPPQTSITLAELKLGSK
jgi:hypothetical protein